MQAMIFAAGLGSRFKPWTDHHPKALALVNGKSLLQRNIEYLQQYGIREVVVNVHHFSDQLVRAIEQNNGWGSEVTISDETNEVLETGGGLKKASPYLHSDPIVIINADILTDLDLDAMLAFHRSEQPLATIAITHRSTSRYFLFDSTNTLCGWRNAKTGEEKVNRNADMLVPRAFSGVHIVSRQLLTLLKWEGKFGIVDVYLELIRDHVIKGYDHNGSKLVDVGRPESVAVAEKLFP